MLHHGTDIGEIEVDHSRAHHQVGDALDALIKHVIGHHEGFDERGSLGGNLEQVLVRDHDQRVHHRLHLGDTLLGEEHAPGTLELEWFGHHADRQNTQLTGNAGNNWRRSSAGAAAHSGGDEAHMAAVEVIHDLLDRLLGGRIPHLGLRSGAQAPGDPDAELDLARCFRV